MSQFEKLIEKIRNAKTNIRFVDIEKILQHFGYENMRQKGSHAHFRKSGAPSLTIPVHKGNVKKVYAKEIFNLLGI